MAAAAERSRAVAPAERRSRTSGGPGLWQCCISSPYTASSLRLACWDPVLPQNMSSRLAATSPAEQTLVGDPSSCYTAEPSWGYNHITCCTPARPQIGLLVAFISSAARIQALILTAT